MQYLSPSTFSGENLSGPLDRKAIQLGRKKLFAELELSGGSTIELNGKPFTKNDIIKYFDELLREDALSYHSAVGEDKVLLVFLEHAWIGRNEQFKDNPLYKDEQFIQWISPYFCHAFIGFMESSFQGEPDEDALAALLSNKLLMTPGHVEKSWEAVTRIIMSDISTLERYHAQDKKRNPPGYVTVPEVKLLMEFLYIRMIQLLPQGRFGSIRDKYAHCMLQVCIDIFNHHKSLRSRVRTWLENAKILAVSPEVKKQITQKLEEMESIQVSSGEKNKESSSSPLKFIVMALIIIVRIATCKSDSSSSYNYQTPVVFPKSTIDRAYLDSLIEESRNVRHLEEGVVAPMDTVVAPMDTVTVTHKIHRRSKHK